MFFLAFYYKERILLPDVRFTESKKILERKTKVKRQTKIENVFHYSQPSLWFSYVWQLKKLTRTDLVGLMMNISIETDKMFVKTEKYRLYFLWK